MLGVMQYVFFFLEVRGEVVCVTRARTSQAMHGSYQPPPRPSAFSVRLSERDVGVRRPLVRASERVDQRSSDMLYPSEIVPRVCLWCQRLQE